MSSFAEVADAALGVFGTAGLDAARQPPCGATRLAAEPIGRYRVNYLYRPDAVALRIYPAGETADI